MALSRGSAAAATGRPRARPLEGMSIRSNLLLIASDEPAAGGGGSSPAMSAAMLPPFRGRCACCTGAMPWVRSAAISEVPARPSRPASAPVGVAAAARCRTVGTASTGASWFSAPSMLPPSRGRAFGGGSASEWSRMPRMLPVMSLPRCRELS